METGRQLAAPATPPRARALLARPPRAGAPGSRAQPAAPARGCRGRGGRGSRRRLARGFPPHRGRAGRREGRRGASATDTCLRGSAPARARRSERARLLPARGAAARAQQPGSSSGSSSSPAPVPSGGPGTTPGRALDAPRPRSWTAAAASACAHTHTHTHMHAAAGPCQRLPGTRGARAPGEVTLPGLPRLLLFLPRRGRGARRRDGETPYEAGLAPGPGVPQGAQSALGPLRPRGQARGGRAARGLLPPQPFLPHFSDTAARDVLALFLPFPPRASSHGRRGTAAVLSSPRLPCPARPTRARLAPSPTLPRGQSPRPVGTPRGQREAEAAGRGRSVFRAPLSFHCPLGCVVLRLADRLRERARLGEQRNYKSRHAPRRKRERRGAGRSGAGRRAGN
ncbi:uncharacterized protein [Vulpes vulpes]|uniref:Collagen alpha-1(I) chain-like n=1 Tax=Vulpes vulpes TaxID=9627 RepID=A0ABM4ZNM4_VULVU